MATEIINTEIKRFDIKTEAKLLKQFGKVFKAEGNITETKALEKDYMLLDYANVCGVITKTAEARLFLMRFATDTDRKIPALDYAEGLNLIPISSYSADYLNKIIACLSASGDAVTISMKKDFPITLENTHFKFILAPRISESG